MLMYLSQQHRLRKQSLLLPRASPAAPELTGSAQPHQMGAVGQRGAQLSRMLQGSCLAMSSGIPKGEGGCLCLRQVIALSFSLLGRCWEWVLAWEGGGRLGQPSSDGHTSFTVGTSKGSICPTPSIGFLQQEPIATAM